MLGSVRAAALVERHRVDFFEASDEEPAPGVSGDYRVRNLEHQANIAELHGRYRIAKLVVVAHWADVDVRRVTVGILPLSAEIRF